MLFRSRLSQILRALTILVGGQPAGSWPIKAHSSSHITASRQPVLSSSIHPTPLDWRTRRSVCSTSSTPWTFSAATAKHLRAGWGPTSTLSWPRWMITKWDRSLVFHRKRTSSMRVIASASIQMIRDLRPARMILEKCSGFWTIGPILVEAVRLP